LTTLLDRSAQEFALRPATEFYGAKLTYGRLWSEVRRFSAALAAHGVGRGTKVAILLPNCPQAVIAFHGTLRLGAVAVMTNPLYVEREMEHQWNDARAEVLIVLDHLYPKAAQVVPRSAIRLVIVTSLREYLPPLLRWLYPLKARRSKLFTAVPYGGGVVPFRDFIGHVGEADAAVPTDPEDLAVIQYTGGTTGVAKGVMLSHRNLVANVLQIASWFPDFRRGIERVMAILPFCHVFGMTVNMNWALMSGATLIVVPRFQGDEFLKTLHQARPTLFPGVPTLFVALIHHPKIRSLDLSSIRFCITGSAPMPVEVLRQFEDITGSVIVEGYGLTEASPVTHVNPIHGTRKPGSIGIPLPDTDARIVSLEQPDEELPVGAVGELIVRGPQVMRGYWELPGETAATLRDGWLHTGDIARMDEDGYFYVVDRKKDMIISGGYNVYPREIDEVLYEHPKVMDAVAVGVPDPYRGETIKAFVVVKPGEQLTDEEVIAFCKARLAAYKVPRLVEFRDSLPKTMVGKVLRKELRAEQAERQASG
jgi:long-chain acyl-CoA synthetase